MSDRITRRATYGDFVAIPPHLVAEIIGGELVKTLALTGGRWLVPGTFQGEDTDNVAPFDAVSVSRSNLFPFDAPPPASLG